MVSRWMSHEESACTMINDGSTHTHIFLQPSDPIKYCSGRRGRSTSSIQSMVETCNNYALENSRPRVFVADWLCSMN